MARNLLELVTGDLEDKRRYRRYRARVEALPEGWREAAHALERYLMNLGPSDDGAALVAMLDDLADLLERSAADGLTVRDVVGERPVEFADAFAANYGGEGWIRKEQGRLTSAIDDAAAAQSRDGGASAWRRGVQHDDGTDPRRVRQVVRADPGVVEAFAGDPANLPRWASGLASGDVRRVGDRLLVASPMGEVAVRFTGRDRPGVLDHDVTLPSGEVVGNPFRVVPHPEGAELVFTVRQGALSDEEFQRDVETVRGDLRRLAHLVETLPDAAS